VSKLVTVANLKSATVADLKIQTGRSGETLITTLSWPGGARRKPGLSKSLKNFDFQIQTRFEFLSAFG
jgi:hypothetical protein